MILDDHCLLMYDPFAGDKDDAGYKHQRNEIVTIRKKTHCLFNNPPHTILPGTKVVRYTAVLPGEGWSSFVICADCISNWELQWK